MSSAQYLGFPFGGTAPATSTVPGNSIIIECENFDSSDAAGTDDGANYNDNSTTPPSGVVGTYNDKSSANLGTSAYRVNTEVDISDYTDASTGLPVTAISNGQGQEYQMYTVQIAQDGNYTMSLRYATGGSGKRQQLFLRSVTDLSTVHRFDDSEDLMPTGNSFTFMDFTSPTQGTTDLVAGTYVIQSRVVVNGPNFDYITITTNSVLSNDEFDNNSITFNNPVKDIFTLSGLNGDVEQVVIYDLVGKQVLTKEVEQNDAEFSMDLSTLNNGMYIVKLQGENVSDFSQKIVKE
ncbi:hypothetical protein IL45_01545 [Nonlabens ulvanivorans]|nr:hypothetical protein IL45_01545 [Nonlabens ulvanivorans]